MPNPSYTFRLAHPDDRQAIVHFTNTHWDALHPAVNLPDFFDYYYASSPQKLNFALAENTANGAIAAIAGFIPANQCEVPDCWVSLWVADKSARGSGLELMAELPALIGCHTLACNNIRPSTRPFYEFLGYATGRVGHFYRLAQKEHYSVARIHTKNVLPATGQATLQHYPTPDSLLQSGFVFPTVANPRKDMWYVNRRYYHFPRQTYDVYGVMLPQETAPRALLITRTVPVLGTYVVRIVDYIGEPDFLPQLGTTLDTLLLENMAEYLDFYCAGVDVSLLQEAGFTERLEGDVNIIPNYLNPPLFENTEYYYFTNNTANFTLFKADGDQDRPNIEM